MKKSGVLATMTLLTAGIFVLFSCEPSTNTDFSESFETVKQVTPITGAQNTTMNLERGGSLDSFFTVSLDGGRDIEGWCIEWNEDASFGLNEGTKLYSTKGQEAWKDLNYFMSIKNDLKAEDPELTFREIQVVIWSLIENPSFDVDKIHEYENVSERIFKDGQPLFKKSKVKDIIDKVKNRGRDNDDEEENEDEDDTPGVVIIENDGQTIMVASETAYAYGNSYAKCFTDFPKSQLKTNKWGWSNGKLGEGHYEFDMYAGAGQCDLSKGTKVGKLIIDYADGTATVKFEMTETSEFSKSLYVMTTTHLYVGNEPLPKKKNGDYTAAPGQYGHIENHDNVTEYEYPPVTGLSGDIYVIGHADVAGFETGDGDDDD